MSYRVDKLCGMDGHFPRQPSDEGRWEAPCKPIARTDLLPEDEIQRIRRTSGVGASEVSALFGLNPWTTELELFDAKTGVKPPEPPTPAMTWGLLHEANIIAHRAAVAAGQRRQVLRTQRVYQSTRCPDLFCSPDHIEIPLGTAFDLDRPGRILCLDDAKTAQAADMGSWVADNEAMIPCDDDRTGIPVYYWLQLQASAWVLGHTGEVALDVLFGNNQPRRFVTSADTETGEMCAAVATSFMTMIREGREPAPDLAHPTTARLLGRRWRAEQGLTRPLDDEHVAALERAEALSAQAKALTEEAQTLRNSVRAHLGEAVEGTWRGRAVVSFSVDREEIEIDLARIREQRPGLFRLLERRFGTTTTTTRRLNTRSAQIRKARGARGAR